MTKKEFTKFELARMKRTAQNVEGFLKQKNKLEEKKAKIEEELATVNEQIELTDAPTVAMTGYHTEDIIKKVVTPTDQVDKNGNIIKKVSFEFIYPDTIIPPTLSSESAKETLEPLTEGISEYISSESENNIEESTTE